MEQKHHKNQVVGQKHETLYLNNLLCQDAKLYFFFLWPPGLILPDMRFPCIHL